MKNNTELLVPAGNYACFLAAVESGADAVYLGGQNYGARKSAENFDNEQLKEAVRFAHLRGVRVHITVNTIMLDKEEKELKKYLLFLDEIGVDAIIVQDFMVLNIAKSINPFFDIHASTQMTIHSLSGALAAKKLGFDRVVLSRELSFEEIKEIAEKSDIEIEIFVHGAMCMSYSGQCLMSSVLGGRSGNRGMCAQPCRQLYGSNQADEKFYALSLKDMSLIDSLSKIKSSKIASLKIEGRMKGENYVRTVCGIYRKYLDNAICPL